MLCEHVFLDDGLSPRTKMSFRTAIWFVRPQISQIAVQRMRQGGGSVGRHPILHVSERSANSTQLAV